MVAIAGLEGNSSFLGIVLFQLVVIPIVVGILTTFLLLRRRLGRVSVRRVLTHDSASNMVAWKLFVTALGRPIDGCTVRIGGETLRWEGTGEKEMDIGADGVGQVTLPAKDCDPNATVVVKSGSFTIYRSSFRNAPEPCLSC